MTPQEIDEVVDYRAFLERTGADTELARELVGLLLRDLPDMLTTMDAAIAAGDAQTLERTAHALKGAVANLSAQPAVVACDALERVARGQVLRDAPAGLVTLRHELSRLQQALGEIMRGPP